MAICASNRGTLLHAPNLTQFIRDLLKTLNIVDEKMMLADGLRRCGPEGFPSPYPVASAPSSAMAFRLLQSSHSD